jgi:hypothetical protein
LFPVRGKKKLWKNLITILIGLKLKAVAFLSLASLAISFVAKKAVLLSLISIVISKLVAVRKLLGQRSRHPHVEEEVYETYTGHHGGGWNRIATAGGYVGQGGYASHSSPAAHKLA